MKITLMELRQIIRNVLKEEAWMPGRWFPNGESTSEKDLDKLGDEGYGDWFPDSRPAVGDEDEDEDE